MGWFSGTTRTHVGISSNRLISDVNHNLTEAVLNAIYAKQGLTTALIRDHISGFNLSVRNYYNYGASGYTNGLAENAIGDETINKAGVQTTLDAIEGVSVEISTILLEPVKGSFAAKLHAKENYAYDTTTGYIHNPPSDLFSNYNEEDLLERYPLLVGGSISNNGYLTLKFVNTLERNDDSLEKVYDQIIVYKPEYVGNMSNFYQVTYKIPGDTKLHYWIYDQSTGVHSALNAANDIKQGKAYLPIVPLITDKAILNAESNQESNIYKTSKTLMTRLGIPVDDLCDSLAENPDIDQIDDAFFLFAVDIFEDTPHGNEYLFNYFDNLRSISSVDKTIWEDWRNNATFKDFGHPSLRNSGNIYKRAESKPPINVIHIYDQQFNVSLYYDYIHRETIQGTFGEVGSYTRELHLIKPEAYVNILDPSGEDDVEVELNESYLTYTYQVDEITAERITVQGLRHISRVYNDKLIISALVSIEEDEDNKGFYIPVNYELAEATMQIRIRRKLYLGSARIVVYAVVKQHLEWYQTEDFLFALEIVGIVLAVFTLGKSLIASQSIAAALYVIAKAYIINLLIEVAIEYIVEEIGGDLALYLAAALAIASVISGGFGGENGLVNAQHMLKASQIITQKVTVDTLNEMDQLSTEYERVMEELEEANDLFETPIDNPLNLLERNENILIDESPTTFYNRVIHVKNPGVLSLNAIESYVDTKLELPKLRTI